MQEGRRHKVLITSNLSLYPLRSTSTTLKNDESSRSHAIVRARIENREVKSAEDGHLLVIDLAGAENAADSQFHDKARIKETKAINSSLMTLKECIKNRAKSVQDPSTFVHIPFRQAKLMLVMKDAFELESHKLSRWKSTCETNNF